MIQRSKLVGPLLAVVALLTAPALGKASPLAVNLCGRVIEFTAPNGAAPGSITLGGAVYRIAPGTLVVDPRIIPGANLCLSVTLDLNGQIAGTASVLPSPASTPPTPVPAAAGGGTPSALPNTGGDALPGAAAPAAGGALLALGWWLRSRAASGAVASGDGY